ncbi:MAG: SDR family oxidoreductase [Bryobacteraceae bacterium]
MTPQILTHNSAVGALTGKSAIVTGGSRGIGRAICSALAAEGARVVVNYSKSAEEAEALAARIGGLAFQADVADGAQVRSLFDATERAFQGIDILVSNAGVALFKPVAEIEDEEYDRTFAVNAGGTFLCCREAARRMRDGGRIVSISSGATLGGSPGGAAYCGSKAAIEQFTRALARELGARQITVNTVSPGFTDTEKFAGLPQPVISTAAARTPLGRLGRPEDVASVVAWLCTGAAGWITGQNTQAGGGLNMV